MNTPREPKGRAAVWTEKRFGRRGKTAGSSAATHGPWLLAAACGVLVAVAGFVTTSARAQASAAAVTEDAG
jgi:hypothetical protein